MLRIGRRSRYSSRPRTSLRKWIITAVILVLLLAILTSLAYFGHKFYRQLQQGPPLEVSYQTVDPASTGKKYFAPIHIDVKHIPAQVSPGEEVKLTIEVAPETICTVLVNDSNSQVERGLYKKEAGQTGRITWDWDVAKSARAGSWPLEVSCTNPQHDASLERTIQVLANKDR